MKKYKTAKRFIKTFRLKGNYTAKNLERILEKQGFTLYEYILFSNRSKQLFARLKCAEIATANSSFSVCSDDVKLCCIRKSVTEKEKTILLLHENLHIFMGDVKKGSPITPMQEKTVTDLHFIIDFILNTKRYAKVLSAVLITVLLLLTVYYFTYSKNSTELYFYVTPGGTHYHEENCDEIIRNTNSFKILAQDAIKSYLPCSKCRPNEK